MLDGIFERKDATLRLRLVADIAVLLAHSYHHSLVARAAHDRREHGTGRIISGESSFHHSGAIVDHTRGGFIVHFEQTIDTRT